MEILTQKENKICIEHFNLIEETLSKINSDSEKLQGEIKKIKEKKKGLEDNVPFLDKKFASWFFSKKEGLLENKLSENNSRHTQIKKYYTSYLSVINCIRFAKHPLSKDIINALISLSEAFKFIPSLSITVSDQICEIANSLRERMKIPNRNAREAFTLRAEGEI